MLAVVIEDEPLNLSRMVKMLSNTRQKIKVIAELESLKASLEWFRDNSPPDVIFLDIQLGDGTAFELLREIKPVIPIIFTTAYDEFAIKAFEYHAVSYLMKPITQDKLDKAIDKLIEQSGNRHHFMDANKIEQLEKVVEDSFKKRFLVKLGDQFFPVDINDVSYFEFKDSSTWMSLINGKFLLMEYSLDQLEKQLNPMMFFRINRQFLVSVRSIKEIHAYFNSRLLLNLMPATASEVIVSRERVPDFKRWMDL